METSTRREASPPVRKEGTKKGAREAFQDVTFGKAYDARLLRRLWVFVQPHRALLYLALVSFPLASAFQLAQPYLIKRVIDEHLVPRVREGFTPLVLFFIVAVVLEFGTRYVQIYITQLLGQRVTRDLRLALFRRLTEIDLSYIERNPIGRLMTRVTNDVESLAELFSSGAISLLSDVITLSGIVGMMLALDWRLTLYAFAVVPVLFGVVLGFRRPAREAFRDVRSLMARLNGFLNEALGGMTLVQIFRQEKAFQAEFEDVNRRYRDANYRSIRFDAMTYAIIEGISTIAVALMLLLGLRLFEQHDVKLGILVAFIDYLRRFFNPITELSNKYTILQSAMASTERCVDLLDQQPSILAPAHPRALAGPVQELRFEDVCFSYSAGGGPVLDHVDIRVQRGEKIAIVGPTGAGKSTIVKLLCRFYDPSSGRISFDGVDIRDLSPAVLRERLAIVLQDPYLFDASIRENIVLGRPISDEAVVRAAERTRASEVIRKQEAGLDTPVGERGTRFSSGERQLIAFARALAQDPEILVLDEATSSVDPETEALIQEGLKGLVADRTAIIIAHRLSTIRSVDRILVLAGGRIVEQGSHETLLALGGFYRNLYEFQFASASTAA